MKENQTPYEYEGNEINLNEDDIVTSYRKAFLKLLKNTSDVQIHSCVCCESLESVRDMTEIANMRKPINTAIWVAVIKDAQEKNRQLTYVCTYCVTQMRKGIMLPYGPATFFLALSPAEWLWGDLIEYIRKVNSPILDKAPEAELIARDPVSVSRSMVKQFHAMLGFICSEQAPLGKVVHYFWRREYQSQGTQHYHMLLWIDDVPILGESTPEEVSEFILKYITCRIPDKKISPQLYKRVTTHKKYTHNSYCLRTKTNKTGKFYKVCRFGFARPETDKLITRDIVTFVAGRKTF